MKRIVWKCKICCLYSLWRMAFYAVARGKHPGVFYTWEECSKEVSGYPGSRYRKFAREKEAWDYVKENCDNMKLSAGTSPVKRKLSTNDDESNNSNMKVRIMERLQVIQEKLQTTCKEIVAEINTIKEELSGVCQTPKKAILIDIAGAPCPDRINKFSTSTRVIEVTASNDVGENMVNTFTVDEDGYVQVFTDGACTKNGFNGAKAGVGVWFGDGHSLNISQPVNGRITNNSAEIEAATLAIECAKLAGVKKLKVYTDSAFLINAITQWIVKWKKNNWKTGSGEPVKNKEELVLLDQVQENILVKFEHVKGHAGIYQNEQADALARAGAEKCTPKKMK